MIDIEDNAITNAKYDIRKVKNYNQSKIIPIVSAPEKKLLEVTLRFSVCSNLLFRLGCQIKTGLAKSIFSEQTNKFVFAPRTPEQSALSTELYLEAELSNRQSL